MTITINGNGTVTGISVGGLPDGIVDEDMIAANAATWSKRGGTGSILQQVSGKCNTKATQYNSSTYAEITSDMRATIIPKITTSKLVIQFNMHLTTVSSGQIRIYKNGTDIVYDSLNGFTNSEYYSNNNFYSAGGPCTTIVEETSGSTDSRYYTPMWATPNMHYLGFNRWTSSNANYDMTSSWQITEVRP